MRSLVMICLTFFALTAYGQKFKSFESTITFYSEAPIEDITATNTDGASAFDIATGEIVFSVPIRSFEFRKSLMQEHFNEKYLESEKYPKAIYKGKLKDFVLKEGLQEVTSTGDLTIHGVTHSVAVDGTMEVRNGTVHLKSAFPVKVEDYNITIPQILWQNIAEEVEVTINFVYKRF